MSPCVHWSVPNYEFKLWRGTEKWIRFSWLTVGLSGVTVHVSKSTYEQSLCSHISDMFMNSVELISIKCPTHGTLTAQSLHFCDFFLWIWSVHSFFIRTMDGVNEVGEVRVSRVQMEGDGESQTPSEHKVAQSCLSLSVVLVWCTVNSSQVDNWLCGFLSGTFEV